MQKYQKIAIIAFLLLFINSITFSQKYNYDKKARDEGAKMVETQMGLIENPLTLEYVREIGQRLVDNLENRTFDYDFFIVDMMEPNAFSLPGGYIYISRGLLILINDEAELAGIIGHEIIHAHNRHSYKQKNRSIFPALLKLPGNIIGVANENIGTLINAPIGIVTGLATAKYSRKHEYEADEFGLQLAAKAGYNPLALATALDNLNKDVEMLTGKETKFSYFDSHPYTPNRVEKINEMSSTLKWEPQSPIASDKVIIYGNLEGIHVGQNPKQGVFSGRDFYQADLGIAISFPEKWNGTNNPSYMGSTQEDGKAMIVWGILGGAYDPDAVADAYINKMKEKHEIEAYKSESTTINGYKAHIFAVDEVSRASVVNMFVCWILKGNLTYQMIGSGAKEFEKNFEATARSFHAITDEERRKVAGIVIRVRTAKANETLDQFNNRTGNSLNSIFTSVINAIDPNEKLKSGQVLKIGRVEQYISKY